MSLYSATLCVHISMRLNIHCIAKSSRATTDITQCKKVLGYHFQASNVEICEFQHLFLGGCVWGGGYIFVVLLDCVMGVFILKTLLLQL